MKKTLSLTLLLSLTACSSAQKLYTTSDEPLSKDHFDWEQAVVTSESGECKFRARDAEIRGVVANQSFIRVEFENSTKTPIAIDPTKVILRSPLLKDSLQATAPEKVIEKAKGQIEGTEKMMNEQTWEGVKEINDELGDDKDSAEVRDAKASFDQRTRERASAEGEKKRLEELAALIERESLKAGSLEPGKTAGGILIYDAEFTSKGSASVDYTGDPCKSSLSFKVKP